MASCQPAKHDASEISAGSNPNSWYWKWGPPNETVSGGYESQLNNTLKQLVTTSSWTPSNISTIPHQVLLRTRDQREKVTCIFFLQMSLNASGYYMYPPLTRPLGAGGRAGAEGKQAIGWAENVSHRHWHHGARKIPVAHLEININISQPCQLTHRTSKYTLLWDFVILQFFRHKSSAISNHPGNKKPWRSIPFLFSHTGHAVPIAFILAPPRKSSSH